MVRFQRPQLPDLASIESYFSASRQARWFANGGPCHDLLRARASTLLHGREVVPVSNAGMGLVLSLRALVDPGSDAREVLLPSFTFAAGAAAVIWCGLQPVFCDVDPDGWHLDAAALERALRQRSGKVAAVLAGSTFGAPVPAEQHAAWAACARAAGVPLIVDSAAGLGATPAADGMAAEVFSMHATKPLPIGEGGLVATHDAALAARIRVLANHGLDADHVAVQPGLNGKLDEWHCATALAALDGLDAALEARRSRFRRLREALAGSAVRFQRDAERSGVQFVSVLLPDPQARERVEQRAGATGIQTRRYFDPPLHRTPAYGSAAVAGGLPVTETLADRILSLPMAEDLSDAELERIAACVSGSV